MIIAFVDQRYTVHNTFWKGNYEVKRLRIIIVAGLIAAFALALSACSSGAIPNTGGTSLNTTMTDFKFSPASWTVPVGKPVTVTLTNSGATPHTWTVMKKPISGSFTAADQADILFDSGTVAAGSSKTVTFTAPSASGSYQVICTQPGHFEAGMIGQLTVK